MSDLNVDVNAQEKLFHTQSTKCEVLDSRGQRLIMLPGCPNAGFRIRGE